MVYLLNFENKISNLKIFPFYDFNGKIYQQFYYLKGGLMKLSNRIMSLKTSPVRKFIPYGEAAIKEGKKIHYLNIGQPDIETPKEFFQAIHNYSEPVLKYAHSAGLSGLIHAISDYYKRRNMDYSGNNEILVVNGGSEALSFVLMTLCDEGDEIVIAEPYYANYNSFFDTLRIKINPVKTYAETGFHLPSMEEFEKSITPKTKAIMLSNPSNPTGVVHTEAEMKMIAEIAKKHDLYIISDEVYREFVYGNNKAISFGTFKELEDRVIIIDSISKRYSACGARIGCIVSKNKEFMSAIYKLCQARLSVPTLEMVGAVALYQLPDSYLETARVEYSRRRDILFKELSSIPGILTKEPEGAFYSVVKLPVDSAEKFVIWLLSQFHINNETIMITPAEGFYSTPGAGKDEVRISYAVKEEDLIKAMAILREGLAKYNSL